MSNLMMKRYKSKEDLMEFITSPFLQSIGSGAQSVLQKYPVSTNTDIISSIDFSSSWNNLKVVGVVNYEENMITLSGNFPIQKDLLSETVKDFGAIKEELHKELVEYFFTELSTKHAEMKLKAEYIEEYNEGKETYFDSIVADIILENANYYRVNPKVRLSRVMENYLSNYVLLDIHNIYLGQLKESVFKKISNRLIKEELDEIALLEVINEAETYVAKGILEEKDKEFKRFVETLKDCPAARFTVVTAKGTYMCRNELCNSRTVTATKNNQSIPIEDILTITYKGKTIYKK